MYPDNWSVMERQEDEGDGVTLELPSGGFLSIDRERQGMLDEEIIEELSETIEAEYDELERESVVLDGAAGDEVAVDFRFYYLDLLIISRVILVTIDEKRFFIQFQAESRDFDANELVLAAILKQIRPA